MISTKFKKTVLGLLVCSLLTFFACDTGGITTTPSKNSNDSNDSSGSTDSGSTGGTTVPATGTSGVIINSGDTVSGGVTSSSEIETRLGKYNISDVVVDLNVPITIPRSKNPHSSGDCTLWATVIRHSNGKKLPTILVATPYRREVMMLLNIAVAGYEYNMIGVDIRGTGSSSDTWTSFDLVEQWDIKYVVDEFIPAQDWSDGSVGMIGASYGGIIQLLTAGLCDKDKNGEPVHLKALFPQVPMSDVYRDIVMHGGNVDLLFIPMWLGIVDAMGALPSLLNLGVDGKITAENLKEAQETTLAHIKHIDNTIGWIMDAGNMNDGPFYTKKSTMIYWPVKPEGGWGFNEGDNYRLSSKMPVMTIGGWFDIFTRGTFNAYQYGLSQHAQTDKKLIIGQYYHIGGAIGMGLNSFISGQLPARWFDWKIKKKNDPFMEEYPVLLYVMGEKKWRGEKSWPLPASRTESRTLYMTKQTPTPIDGDWYTDEPATHVIKWYNDNNYGLSETPDYSGDNPRLTHDPLNLNGSSSRSSVRWLMGMEALLSEGSRNFLDYDMDSAQWYEDERSDENTALTFTTEPLEEDVEIIGPLAVTFWAKTKFADPLVSSTIDTIINTIKQSLNITSNLVLDTMNEKDVQWVAELNDVFPGGRARNVSSGWLAASHRQYDPSGATSTCYVSGKKVTQHAQDPDYTPFNPFYHGPDHDPVLINEGELYQYTVELWPTCNVFKAGHRIRVSLSASDFPHLLPLVQPSTNTIVIDKDHIAKVDFTEANTEGEGTTWDWIGDNGDVDSYLLSGTSVGCGTQASAAPHKAGAAAFISELFGLVFIMMIPLSLIAVRRFTGRKRVHLF